jgi:hypothetical protein
MDKKYLVLIIGLIILIIVAGFIYYKYYYPYSGHAPALSKTELGLGAYYGFYNQKRPGTPNDWVWHGAGLSSAWTAPNKSIASMGILNK